jgi:hypothetical protein
MLWLIFWMFLIPAAISLAKALIHFVCCHHFSSLPFVSGSKKISTCRDANIVKMVRAAVHINWGRRRWAWASHPLCSRRRGKAASEQNAWASC